MRGTLCCALVLVLVVTTAACTAPAPDAPSLATTAPATPAPTGPVLGEDPSYPGRLIRVDGGDMCHVRKALTGGKSLHGAGPTGADFDGDGVDDIAADAELEHLGQLACRRAVVIRYAAGRYVDYLAFGSYTLDPPKAPGDFNGDGYDDLAIGAPEEKFRAGILAGGVWIIPGSPDGLRPEVAVHVTEDSPGVPDDPRDYGQFGAALAAGDLNGDGRDDLAIGTSKANTHDVHHAGKVTVLFGSASGITTTGAVGLDQDMTELPGHGEAEDRFGASLAIGHVNRDRYADLVISTPGEDAVKSGKASAGKLTLIWGGPAGLRLTDVTSVAGRDLTRVDGAVNRLSRLFALGDTDGDGLDDIVMLSRERLLVIPGRATGLSASGVHGISRAALDLPELKKDGDFYHYAMAVGDVTGDGRADVVIGSSGAAVGATDNAGRLTLLLGSAAGLTGAGARAITQDSKGVPGFATNDNHFGGAVAILNLDGEGPLDLAVGAWSNRPATGGSTGTITSFTGTAKGLTPGTAWFCPPMDVPGIELQYYGSDIAGSARV